MVLQHPAPCYLLLAVAVGAILPGSHGIAPGEEAEATIWSPRAAASAVQSQSKLFLFGGVSALDSDRTTVTAFNDVWVSDNAGSDWRIVTHAAEWEARAFHAAVVDPKSGSPLLIGGLGGPGVSTVYNDVWRMSEEGDSWTRLSRGPWKARSAHCAVATPSGDLVLAGGFQSDNLPELNDVWGSSDGGATWSLVTASAPWRPRSEHACVALSNGEMLLMGGIDGEGLPIGDAWVTADGGKTWTALPHPPWEGREGLSAAVVEEDWVLVVGGRGRSYLNDAWLSKDMGRTWSAVNTDAPWYKRGYSACVRVGQGMALLGGINDDSSFTYTFNDVWLTVNGTSWIKMG